MSISAVRLEAFDESRHNAVTTLAFIIPTELMPVCLASIPKVGEGPEYEANVSPCTGLQLLFLSHQHTFRATVSASDAVPTQCTTARANN